MDEGSFQPEALTGTHDLRMSAWGPYTKRYSGVSHIPDVTQGLRFDLSVFPAFHHRAPTIPTVTLEANYHPWKATTDLSYYSHRHELVWKDQVYGDVAYLRASERKVLVQTRLVNETAEPQSLVLYYLASLHFPPLAPYSLEPRRVCRVVLPDAAVWVDALAYTSLSPRPEDPRDGLPLHGAIRGEVAGHGLVEGQGLLLRATQNGTAANHREVVEYVVDMPVTLSDAVLVLRSVGPGARVSVQGHSMQLGSEEPAVTEVPLGSVGAGAYTVVLECAQGELTVDGLSIVSANAAQSVGFEEVPWDPVPQIEQAPENPSMLLRYRHVEDVYGVAWNGQFQLREFQGDDVDLSFRRHNNSYRQGALRGDGKGHYTNVMVGPIVLEAKAERTLHGMVACGSPDSVRHMFAEFSTADPATERFEAAERGAELPASNIDGDRYRFGQQLMAATIATNVVYPIRTQGRWIRHYTPGRHWDCLYTMDCGLVGIGLAELDIDRSIDLLNTYLTEPNQQPAFIHHGSVVPTQFYQFLELWNRTGSDELAAFFYPGLLRYYRFLAGHDPRSTTRHYRSGLLCTWDYWTNTGWDDYPAQVHTVREGLTKQMAPVVITAHVIRCARILRMAAAELGEPVAEFDQDIARFEEALQRHSWDAESGYFSYVVHDPSGEPSDRLRHPSGANFNMGVGGASPLFAGSCTPEQEKTLVGKLTSPDHLWSRHGLSVVDFAAPYYSDDGMFNGGVWMIHQWFLWKTYLTLGYADEARQVAQTALSLWETEVEASYNCWEHFHIPSGRGMGWHHFSGLSSPILSWFYAYHVPGRLTVGLDTVVKKAEFGGGRRTLRAELHHHGEQARQPVVLVVVAGDRVREATWNGAPVPFQEVIGGTAEVTLPSASEDGTLEVG